MNWRMRASPAPAPVNAVDSSSRISRTARENVDATADRVVALAAIGRLQPLHQATDLGGEPTELLGGARALRSARAGFRGGTASLASRVGVCAIRRCKWPRSGRYF